MSKHTPGPWEASLAANSAGQRHIYDIGHNPIAGTIHNDRERPEQIAANARLISAAPDLLEALKALLLDLVSYDEPEERLTEHERKARAAIAKAIGETQ